MFMEAVALVTSDCPESVFLGLILVVKILL